MNKKFIVNDGVLIMGHPENHSDLVIGFDDTKVTGGGWWHLDRVKGNVYLYSSSHQYGKVSFEDIKKAIETGYLTGFQETFTYYFSEEESLGDAMKNSVKLERKR